MALCSSDVTRLICHHLLKEGYEKSADALVGECPQLKDFKPANQPYKLLWPSLVDLLEIYSETKDFVIEELTLLKSVFKEHESLLIFSQKLVENIKYLSHSILMSAIESCTETQLSAEEEDKTMDFTSVQENKNNNPFENFVIGQNVNTDFERPVDPTSETILKNGESITKFFLFPP